MFDFLTLLSLFRNERSEKAHWGDESKQKKIIWNADANKNVILFSFFHLTTKKICMFETSPSWGKEDRIKRGIEWSGWWQQFITVKWSHVQCTGTPTKPRVDPSWPLKAVKRPHILYRCNQVKIYNDHQFQKWMLCRQISPQNHLGIHTTWMVFFIFSLDNKSDVKSINTARSKQTNKTKQSSSWHIRCCSGANTAVCN